MWSQKDGRLSTIMKMKVLASKCWKLHWVRVFKGPKPALLRAFYGECVSNMPGSKSMVGNRIVYIGTWESHIASRSNALAKLKKQRQMHSDMAVGLTHSRGVDGVMPIESPRSLEGVSSQTQRDEEAYAIH